MWTSDWETATLCVVGTERVKNELFVAITTGNQPLRAFAKLVLAQVPSLYFHAALVLAVQWLVTARPRVFL